MIHNLAEHCLLVLLTQESPAFTQLSSKQLGLMFTSTKGDVGNLDSRAA